jgi:hypothetical protein
MEEVTMYEDLKTELQQIVELVETVPDRYKDRCFEMLLTSLLSEQQSDQIGKEDKSPPRDETHDVTKDTGSKPPPTPAKVRAFMGRNNVSDDELRKLVLIEGGELHFIHEPEVSQNAVGQIQWALLLALKAALLGGEIEVDAEAVRSVCIEKGLYDKGNFATNFKKAKTAALFNSPPEPQGKAVRLSGPGEKRLAELIKNLVS